MAHNTTITKAVTTVHTVLPPKGAQSANDLYGIKLTESVERANRATHYWIGLEMRCGVCDCRPSGEWARFACTAVVR